MTVFYNLGLTGFPVRHSLSPKLHQAALQSFELKGEYRLYPVPPFPEGLTIMRDLLEKMRAGFIHGLNVTIPNKQSVIPLLDRLTETAQAIGAVNVIYYREGELVGENTDAMGFILDLKRFLGGRQLINALVLGAGGSARAVVYALSREGCQVWLAARRIDQAKDLSKSLRIGFENGGIFAIPLEKDAITPLIGNCDLIINTTPVGMSPMVDVSPWPEGLIFPPAAAIYDLIYNPIETLFVKKARINGLPAATGLGMLVEQAALAFQCWTGLNPPFQKMWQAVTDLSLPIGYKKG